MKPFSVVSVSTALFLCACQKATPLQTIPLDFFVGGTFARDLDGDNRVEIILEEFGRVLIFSQNAQGVFAESAVLEEKGPFLLEDFEQDGDLDLIVSRDFDLGRPNSLELFSNEGGLQFTSRGLVSITEARRFTLGDADQDADLDILFARPVVDAAENFVRFELVVLPNDGLGNFGAEIVSALPGEDLFVSFQTLSLLDLDGDGVSELIVGTSPAGDNATGNVDDEPQIFQMENVGGGLFGAPAELIPARSAFLQSGDFDGDGDLDLLESDFSLPPIAFLNDGEGAFSEIEVFSKEGYNFAFIKDIDGDDTDEILHERFEPRSIVLEVFSVSEQGAVAQEEIELKTGPDLSLHTLEDLNGDGRVEILAEHFDEDADNAGVDPGFALVLFALP